MIRNRQWIALFSQTGSEIVNLSKHLGIEPDIIFTNNLEPNTWHKGIIESNSSVIGNKHLSIMEMLKCIDNPIITLHGYLRILPPDICNMFEIYNGHPGAIELYPELKGKDPQQKVIDRLNWYPYIGSVVHRVTETVDDGEIVARYTVRNKSKNSIDVIDYLRYTSLWSWLTFFTYFR
jgi:methionyl-tRNA formyltransferase